MYLAGWKDFLPVNEVHVKSFWSMRYMYLVDWKETLPAGLGYPLGYPPVFCGKGAIRIRWRIEDDPQPSLATLR
jgi:hypothetical protein